MCIRDSKYSETKFKLKSINSIFVSGLSEFIMSFPIDVTEWLEILSITILYSKSSNVFLEIDKVFVYFVKVKNKQILWR